MADEDSWKNKYLNALDTQEFMQKEWQARQLVLNELLAKVAVAATGQSRALDQTLQSLRGMIREQAAVLRLEGLLKPLEQQVIDLDRERSDEHAAGAEAFVALCEGLLAIHPGGAVARELKGLIKAVKGEQVHSGALSALRQCQQQILQPAENNESRPFWSRLLGATDKPVSAAVRAMAETGPDSEVDCGQISGILSRLLEQLEIPDDLQDSSRRLRERLQGGLLLKELAPVLEEVSSLVIGSLYHDQHAFEAFLQNLDVRLKAMQDVLSQSQQVGADVGQENRLLDQTVRGHLAGLSGQTDTAGSLGELQGNVRRHLEVVAATLDRFSMAQAEREEVLLTQFGAMASRIAELEKQSREANQSLEEQRQRLLRDKLTELPNREAYEQRLAEELSRWQRYQRPFSFAVCDIDRFKTINDSYGHLAGDKVLKVVASLLRKRLRASDFIARYGGEEFVIVLPETRIQDARSAVEILRMAVEECPFHFREQRIPITISFGVTECAGDDTAESLFGRADKALYRAKDMGRNRTEMAET